MRIAHICLAAYYMEGWGYQENILPKAHISMGHDCYVLTSDYMFDQSGKECVKKEKEYINPYGIKVKVLDKTNRYGYYSRFHDYVGVYEELEKVSPDIIFVHGGQFVALKDVIKYCKGHRNNVKMYIDQHGDYYNTPVKRLKKWIVQKYIYGHWMRKAIKYTEKFWGVTPWRCRYLNEVYGIPKNKIDLLIMGADDDNLDFENRAEIRQKIRKEYNISENDFLIITGGKIDGPKNIHLLIEAVNNLNDKNVKLMVFGNPTKDFEKDFFDKINGENIIYIGWIDSHKVYDYFFASDMACFPGTHSVLWEQACASKLPCLFKLWEDMTHVNNGGNADFIKSVSVENLKEKVIELKFTEKYFKMKNIAESDKTDVFLYSNIAKKSLECTSMTK